MAWLAFVNIWMFVFVVGILISVFLHETGHFVTARLTGHEGHPVLPRLRAPPVELPPGRDRVRRAGRCRSARSCAIIGMNNLDEVPPQDEARTYRQESYPRRMLVITAGSIMHILIAIVLLFAVYVDRRASSSTSAGRRVARAAAPAARPREAGIRTATSS